MKVDAVSSKPRKDDFDFYRMLNQSFMDDDLGMEEDWLSGVEGSDESTGSGDDSVSELISLLMMLLQELIGEDGGKEKDDSGLGDILDQIIGGQGGSGGSFGSSSPGAFGQGGRPTGRPINGIAKDAAEAVRRGSQNTPETDANQARAQELYGHSNLSGATDPVDPAQALAAQRVDPWVQYIGEGNADLTVHELQIQVQNADGSTTSQTFKGQELADLINSGQGGAAYNFQDNSTEPLNAKVNADGSVTVNKSDISKFTHLFVGGVDGGVQGMTIAIKASGDGYLQSGVDFKGAGFEGDGWADGDEGELRNVNSAYQRVTEEAQWFGLSSLG